ncbi:MAG: UDP-N-acetylmuramoyl-L-alanine--D-glutamate ligase [Sedimentisphaerales bacterium]|nr:UDP-N-acetylmuramoyl-L-alanine--D-glutamate ligase [Sedimentisphaerales bacterium]
MPDDRYNFAGKKVLIMGLGRFGGGVDCAQFAARAGAKVTVTDSAPAEKLSDSINKLREYPDIEFHLGSHDAADFKEADIIIANPAVPDDNEFLEIARRNNKFVTYQINIFFELCPAQIVGITGANGKSTTTALTAHLLRNTSIDNVWLSGNIGNQPLLTILGKIKADDLVVLELSSFQLESLAQIAKAPNVALLTNLTPNHLDRHGTFENYCAAKENIFKYQKLNNKYPAVSIFNAEDKIGAEWFEKYSEEPGRICIRFSSGDVSKDICDSFKLPGRANLSNLAAAITVAKHFGIDDEQIKKSLPEFKPLPHRLEFIAEINGVSWYNDSIATTPQSAIAALEAFEQPKIIIAGGYDKDLPFDELGQKIAANAKAAVLLGQTAAKIASAIRKTQDTRHKTQDRGLKTHIEIVNSLAKAVQLTARLAAPGDVVLLSPACASYDMFENFQQRGLEFTKLVRAFNS